MKAVRWIMYREDCMPFNRACSFNMVSEDIPETAQAGGLHFL